MTSLSNGDITLIQQMIASGSGALMTSLFMTPLDVVKTRLQAQAKAVVQNRCYIYCNGLMDHLCLCSMLGSPYNPIGQVPATKFTSSMDAFIKIVRNEGITSLWRGLPPTLVMAVPNVIIYFTLYDQLKVLYGFEHGETNIWTPILSGSSARTISTTVISPIEMIRTKLQSRSGYRYKELGSVIRTAIQQGGVFTLWQGLGPSLLRDIPFSAIYWLGYEYIRSKTGEPTFGTAFVGGAGSGLVAAVLTQPFDVVKTHRQMELGEMEFVNQKKLPLTASLIMKLYREKGVASLFAGLGPRMVKVPPACAIMISIYEYGKHFFAEQNLSRRQSSI